MSILRLVPRPRKDLHLIWELPRIRTLTSPVRQDIVDIIEGSGPCSVAQLAQWLGRSADSLYYHVRRLHRLGLLREWQASGSGGRSQAVFDVPGRPMRMRYAPSDPRNATAIAGVVGAMLRSALRGFRQGFVPDLAVPSGRHRNVWGARAKGWLTAADLAEANRLLERLIALMKRGSVAGPGARRLHELTFVLAPMAPRGRRERRRKRMKVTGARGRRK